MKIIILYVGIVVLFLAGCRGCSRSGQKQMLQESSPQVQPPLEKRREPVSSGDKTVVKMEEINGVYQIPVEIDGVKLAFIFDTGASTISISETEAILLKKQGLLSDTDIKGSERYSDANGNMSEGTVITLRTVKIGDRVLNSVDASVVHNLNAPLLFGQSALKQFGEVSIDYNAKEITFK